MAIVVGVDGSEESLRALRWAVDEGRLRRSVVQVVYVWHYPTASSWVDPYGISSAYGLPEVDPEVERRRAEGRLAGLVAKVEGAGEVEEKLIEGHPAEALLFAAHDAELLVVGSRGHGGFAGMLLGSVSQACVHHARCPVVVIRSGAG